MNFPLLKLELRKNRLSAASVAAAFLVTLPVSRLVAGTTGMEPGQALEAILLFWMIMGSPFAAALIASSAGALTASRSDRESEALLPVSPLRRAGASIAASALLLAAVTMLLVTTAWAFGALTPQLLARNPALNWGRPFWMDSSISPIFVFALIDALLSCWIMSYLIGNGVAGALLGLLVTGASLFVAAIGGGMQIEHEKWGVSLLPLLAGLGAATLAAKLAAAGYAAAWHERSAHRGAPGVAALTALILFGPLSGAVMVNRAYAALGAQVAVAGPQTLYHHSSLGGDFPLASRAMAAAGKGAILKTVRGGIVIADAEGIRTIIPERSAGISDLLFEPYKTWIKGAWLDENGVLWVERYVSPNTELWRVEDGKAESIRLASGGSISMVAGVLLNHRYPDRNRLMVARTEDYFRRRDKATWLEGYKSFLTLRRRETGAARAACGGKCLEAGGRRWKLPGIADKEDDYYPHDFGAQRAYLVLVHIGDDSEVVLCRADGTTEIAWPASGETYGALPDGTLFSFDARSRLWAIDPDAKVAAPLDLTLSMPGSKPALMRRAEGKVWLVAGGKLVVLDAGGRTVFSKPLPEGIEDAVPLKDGFLIATKRSAYFSDWNGALRRVENPR